MPILNEAVKGDECQCGRRYSVLHCTVCGSTRVYARIRRLHRMLDGSTKEVEIQYRCQKCAHLFIPEERKYCEAPPTNRELAKRRAMILGRELMRTNPERAEEIIAGGGDVGQSLAEENKSLREASEARGGDIASAMSNSEATGVARGGDHEINTNESTSEARVEDISISPDNEPLSPQQEKLLRDEWLRLRLNGNQLVPKIFEEYVQRVRKGEVF